MLKYFLKHNGLISNNYKILICQETLDIEHVKHIFFQAGIETNRLVIALEPEAASIFCKEVLVEKFEEWSDNINVFQEGQKYLVLDAGGNI